MLLNQIYDKVTNASSPIGGLVTPPPETESSQLSAQMAALLQQKAEQGSQLSQALHSLQVGGF